jgi:hypothetical protein
MAHGDASEPRCERVGQRRPLLKGGGHHQLRGRISVFEDWSLANSRVPECGKPSKNGGYADTDKQRHFMASSRFSLKKTHHLMVKTSREKNVGGIS